MTLVNRSFKNLIKLEAKFQLLQCKISFSICKAFCLYCKARSTENMRKSIIFFLKQKRRCLWRCLFPESCDLFETDSENHCADFLFKQFSSYRRASALWLVRHFSIVRLSLLEMLFLFRNHRESWFYLIQYVFLLQRWDYQPFRARRYFTLRCSVPSWDQ